MIGRDEVHDLLAREALCLDRRDWDGWLSLYTDDCSYWMPAWRDEENPTDNPDRELSLIWYQGKHNLEDRVWRVKSGLSIASVPMLRTAHQVSAILIEGPDTVSASFACHVHNVKRRTDHCFFGRYEYRLVHEGDALKIAAKKILLMNDNIPTVADFYML
ncbi:MAG: aromatic-ring-hydroxylating dioxygenase subunit beta [Sphingomonadales bacterium]|jgi:3-phenylpropionate/cinnamic acid dioxygenase small subunit|nr:aromatic-ring-hydroxylating dioxygenase subunit beta [Sphingomonadales bacterium]